MFHSHNSVQRRALRPLFNSHVKARKKSFFPDLRLTDRTVIHRTAEISFLCDYASAPRTARRQCIFGHFCPISPIPAKKRFFRIAAALLCHFAQNSDHTGKKSFRFSGIHRRQLSFGMNPSVIQNILQNAVSDPRETLLCGKKRFALSVQLLWANVFLK